jgi:hypothetical protein
LCLAGLVMSTTDEERNKETEPLELLVENEDYFKTAELTYGEGEKYLQLERDATKPDLLSEILKPLTPESSR